MKNGIMGVVLFRLLCCYLVPRCKEIWKDKWQSIFTQIF